jgi:hypothetical protein
MAYHQVSLRDIAQNVRARKWDLEIRAAQDLCDAGDVEGSLAKCREHMEKDEMAVWWKISNLLTALDVITVSGWVEEAVEFQSKARAALMEVENTIQGTEDGSLEALARLKVVYFDILERRDDPFEEFYIRWGPEGKVHVDEQGHELIVGEQGPKITIIHNPVDTADVDMLVGLLM